MRSISRKDRKAVETIVTQLLEVANSIDQANSTMAALYRRIANAIDRSLTKKRNGYCLELELPIGCSLTLAGYEETITMKTPATLTVLPAPSKI